MRTRNSFKFDTTYTLWPIVAVPLPHRPGEADWGLFNHTEEPVVVSAGSAEEIAVSPDRPMGCRCARTAVLMIGEKLLDPCHTFSLIRLLQCKFSGARISLVGFAELPIHGGSSAVKSSGRVFSVQQVWWSAGVPVYGHCSSTLLECAGRSIRVPSM
jgi:hypothetical protein